MKRIQFIFSILIAAAIATGFQRPGAANMDLIPKIEKTEIASGHYQFKASLLNNKEVNFTGSYQLQTQRTGKAGTSHSSQSGEITAKPNQEIILSSSSVNIQRGDHWEVILSIYHENTLVVSDTLTSHK